MALVKSPEEIEKLHAGGKILSRILALLTERVRSGVNTMELEELALQEVAAAGAAAAFKGYQAMQGQPKFPAALCTSLNEEIVHCIPKTNRLLKDGDVISLDLGVKYNGLFTDAAITLAVGEIGKDANRLLEVTKKALYEGIKQVRPGNTIGDIAHAIEQVGKKEGLGVIQDLVGHSVGHAIHEDPAVPNYGTPGSLEKLVPGMVLAIEPMFTLGSHEIKLLQDGWSIVTADKSLSAHFEHTVAVTREDYLILTE